VRNLSFGIDTTDEDLVELSLAPSVHRLDFSDCHFVTGEGFGHVPAKVQSLDFACCRALNDAGLRGLSHCTSLTSLDLSGGMQFSDAGLQVLSRMRSLCHVNLSGCAKLTDAGAAAMQELPLRTLKLTHCHRLTCLRFVRSMSNLETLDLSWCTSLTDESFSDLACLSRLRHLNCRGCYQLTEFGLQQLAFLPLRNLTLCGGVSLRSVDADLPLTIEELQLSHCDMLGSLEGVSRLVHLRDLRLDDCHHLTDANLQALSGLVALHTLDLSSCHEVSDVSALGGLTELRELSFAHNARVHDLNPLRGLTALQSLSLQGCNIDDDDVWVLSGMTHMAILNMRHCSNVTDRGLQGLAPLTAMRTLDLHGCRAITDTGLRALSGMARLQNLILSNCEGVSHLRALTSLQALRMLKISGCGLTDQGMRTIGSLAALSSLELTHCPDVTDAGLDALQGLSLERLELESMENITNRGVSDLMWALSSLRTIYVDRCKGVDDMTLPWYGGTDI